MWHMLNAHPCLLSAVQPMWRFGGITTKETYYFTMFTLNPDARELLIPWMGFSQEEALGDAVIAQIGDDWLQRAQQAAVAHTQPGVGARVFAGPPTKLTGFTRECDKMYILEGVSIASCCTWLCSGQARGACVQGNGSSEFMCTHARATSVSVAKQPAADLCTRMLVCIAQSNALLLQAQAGIICPDG